ncbi:MAG TPA: hypothetical protein VG889_17465 [Rhizomicrobium sp.]|nr:hypothetical protein [Rhizomicrobium sp.]
MLVLHIGTHKTGTSALQAFLVANAEALRARGLNYMRAGLGQAMAHHALAWGSRNFKGRDNAVWADLRAELADNPDAINIVSSEGLWFADPATVAPELEGVGPVKVIVYLRRQDRYLQSLYKQGVTSGRRSKFETWRIQQEDRGDFLTVLRQWADAFGKENIDVRPYDRPEGRVDVTADFFDAIGADVRDLLDARNPDARWRHNPSPRRELLMLLRALNRTPYELQHDKFFWAVVHGKRDLVASGDLLSHDECAKLVELYAESNRTIEEEFYGGKVLFPPLEAKEPPAPWGIDDDETMRMTAHFLSKLIEATLAGAVVPEGEESKRWSPQKAGKNKKKNRQSSSEEED